MYWCHLTCQSCDTMYCDNNYTDLHVLMAIWRSTERGFKIWILLRFLSVKFTKFFLKKYGKRLQYLNIFTIIVCQIHQVFRYVRALTKEILKCKLKHVRCPSELCFFHKMFLKPTATVNYFWNLQISIYVPVISFQNYQNNLHIWTLRKSSF